MSRLLIRLLLMVLCAATPLVGRAAEPTALAERAAHLGQALRREIPWLIIDPPSRARRWVAYARGTVAANGYSIRDPQLMVIVDRNPAVQQLRIVLALPSGPWRDLGGTQVSTGQPGRYGYFVTPKGVFLHDPQIRDWRAEGTLNEHGIRGLGVRGMRVWDFGWQSARRGWGPPGKRSAMRPLMHATDPVYLEPRLGHPASRGCVRISDAMNRFLDRHGVLDRDYEETAGTDSYVRAVVLPDRAPTSLAGDKLVVIDSSESAPFHVARE